MARISFALPCEPEWVEGIYQLEVSDLVLGYDPTLAKDGPANRQWRELGDRTLFLRKLLEAAHKNGRHAFTAADFAENTVIPEEKLALDVPTGALAKELEELEIAAKRATDLLNQRNSEDLSPACLLGKLLPWIPEYFDNGASFDLIGDTSMLRAFTSARITSEIAGDDSLDITDTRGVSAGQSYFLMDEDGGNLEEAKVLSILTDTRVRFETALKITRSTGILCSANIPGSLNGAQVYRDFVWRSSLASDLCGGLYGKMFVHRDKSGTEGRVFWQEESSDEWHEAELAERMNFYDGTVDDVFILPAKKLRLKAEYPASDKPFSVYWIALKLITKFTLPETVRQPEIEELELRGQTLTVKGNGFASLWNLPQGGFELRVNSKNNFGAQAERFDICGEAQGMSALLSPEILELAPLVASIRYRDCEGKLSRWSPPQEISTQQETTIAAKNMESGAWAR